MVLAWNNEISQDDLEHMGDLEKAYLLSSKYLSTEDYQDVHVNILTPISFLDLIETASKLGLFDYEIASFHDTFYNSHEFIVSFRRLPRELLGEPKLIRQTSNIASVRKQLGTSGINIIVASSPGEIQYRLGISQYILACSMMNVGSAVGLNLKVNTRFNNSINVKIKVQETHPQNGQIIGGDLNTDIGIGESRTFLLSVIFSKNVDQHTLISVEVVDSFGAIVGSAEIPILLVDG